MPTIVVNGKTETVAVENVADYIRSKDLNPKTLVVEYNGQVIEETSWARTALGDGGQLELLSFVGGG